MRLDDWRSTVPSVAVMLVLVPVEPTQCAAVSTSRGLYNAPPHPSRVAP